MLCSTWLQGPQGLGIMIIEGKHAEVGQGIFISDIQEGSAAEQVWVIGSNACFCSIGKRCSLVKLQYPITGRFLFSWHAFEVLLFPGSKAEIEVHFPLFVLIL